MSEENQLEVVDGIVVTMAYALTVDGEVIEDSTSDDGEELSFLQGAGQVLPALENALKGLKVGDRKEVTLQPADGYGEIDPEAFEDYERGDFPDDIPLEVGTPLMLTNEDGEEDYAVIDAIEGDLVRLNYNHELAGKVLNFAIQITGLRQPTDEERDHGHVHYGHDHDDEDEEE